MMLSVLLYSFVSLITRASSSEVCYGVRTPDEISRTLWGEGSNYTDKQTRPSVSKLLADNPIANPLFAKPDIIKARLNIIKLKGLDQRKGEVEIFVHIQQLWNDFRLAYNSSGNCFPANYSYPFALHHFSNIWKPATTVTNLVSEHKQGEGSIRIYPNGDVVYGRAHHLTTSCKFKFNRFPKDRQDCFISLSSFVEDTSMIVMELAESPITKILTSIDPVEWDVTTLSAFTGSYKVEAGVLLSYSFINFTFSMERQSDYYMHFVVFPVILMVVISWTSFYIDRGAVPARVTLSMVSFLTITSFIGGQLNTLPMIGGNDAWLLTFMQVSMLFSFFAVIEYAICNYLGRLERQVKAVQKQAEERKQAKISNEEERHHSEQSQDTQQSSNKIIIKTHTSKEEIMAFGSIKKVDAIWLAKNGSMLLTDEKVERFSRHAYPIAYSFACLVLLYKLRLHFEQ